MPINESSNNLRSNDLTPEQERAAQAAVYGLPNLAQMLATATPQELAQLKALLRETGTVKPPREFDLNHPPRDLTLDPDDPTADGPYRYQPFPRIIYQHEERSWRLVQNQAQMEHWIAQGWRIDPYPTEAPEETELDEATLVEVAAIDRELRKKKKGQQS